jgi:uncharacterized protein (DUF305 family)
MRVRALLTAAAAAALLAGCGTASAQQPAATRDRAAAPAAVGAHNATDVTFLQMMIAHAAQGRRLTELGAKRAVREEVRQLAAAIQTTQADEVKIMESWLRGWQEPTDVAAGESAHVDHGGEPATGEQEIAQLQRASGAEFEKMFLGLLTGHQHGAVEMAQRVAADGANPQTKDLAERIAESRTQQIAQMLRLMN